MPIATIDGVTVRHGSVDMDDKVGDRMNIACTVAGDVC